MITQWLMKKAAAIATAESIVAGLAAETAAVGTLTAAYYALATAKAAAGILGAIGGLGGVAPGGGGGGAFTFGGGAMPFAVNPALAPTFHTGGIVGKEAFRFTFVPPEVFVNAPRYHSSLGPGERAAIFRDDEGIFTPGQMKAMGLMAREGAAEKPEVKIDIANIVSPDLLDSYLATSRGQNAILNVMSSRAGTIRRIMRS